MTETDGTHVALVARPEAPELTPFEVMERVIASGDIGQMDPQARVAYYWRVCESLGLNPITRPFQFLNLNGKIVLYATKDATEQLRRLNRVSVTSLTRERDEELGLYVVTAHVRLPDGREDESTGAVSVKGLLGEALANAIMKAETKAKRRATLSAVGLGFLDESEVEGIGEQIDVDTTTGEITEVKRPTLLESVQQQADALAGGPAAASQADVSPEAVVESTKPEASAETASTTVKPKAKGKGKGKAKPEPETILAEPMTPEASAAVSPLRDDIDDLVDEIADEAGMTETEEELLAQVRSPAPPGLTIQALADLARKASVGKAQFSEALGVTPADLGSTIEQLTDEGRYAVALKLGLV